MVCIGANTYCISNGPNLMIKMICKALENREDIEKIGRLRMSPQLRRARLVEHLVTEP